MYKSNRIGVHVEKNAFIASDNGLISFPAGQVITDNSVQRNGTKYDIASMDLSEYSGQITADHVDSLSYVIGKALGVAKTDNAVTISGIQFAVKENAMGKLAYDLMSNGFVSDLSIETYGPWPDESDNTYYNAKLVGLSAVVVGNNKSATINELVHNSFEQAKQEGLDTSEAEKFVQKAQNEAEKPVAPQEDLKPEPKPDPKEQTPEPEAPKPEPQLETPQKEVAEQSTKKEQDMKFVTIKNGRDFPITVTYKNAAGEEVGSILDPSKSVDVSEDQKELVEKQLTEAEAPKVDIDAIVENKLTAALAPLMEKFNAMEQNAFDKQAKEPEFHKEGNGAEKRLGEKFANLQPNELLHKQVNAAWDAIKNRDLNAQKTLDDINGHNLERLQKDGKVSNSITIGDFGNFVFSPELLSKIEGIRTDYTPLIDATEWQETLHTQMAWLSRSGDISMQPVAFLDNANNDNLKPISDYTATINTSNLEELAAVTPVMTSATRFLAADLMSDIAAGYRNDYDRKRAQLVVARLEQAVNGNGNSVPYALSTNTQGIEDFLDVWTSIGNKTPNGIYLLGTSSLSQLMKTALSAGPNGPLSTIFGERNGAVPMIFGRPYVVVSDDLLPRLNTNDSVSFVVDGVTVPITQSVFYFNPINFTGRTSGGLQYDLSFEAAYEDNGVVKSAFQRNELVLRGSFFRGGVIKDEQQVASLASPGLS